jgi:hypothetical protein
MADLESCGSEGGSRTPVGLEGCLRQVALEYSDEVRAEAEDYLDALDALIRLAGGLQSRATVIALSHGVVMNTADVVVEAARAVYGNTEELAGLRLEIGTGEGTRVERNRLLERALREGVTLHFIDRHPPLASDHSARLGTPYESGARPMEVAHTAPQHDLQKMAGQTGGVFLADDDLFAALTRIRELERGGYLLGYYLDEQDSLDRMGKARVKTVRKGVRISHRRGYLNERDTGSTARGSLVLGVPLSLEEDGKEGQFVPFTIVADPESLGYRVAEGSASASLTLSTRVELLDGRSLAETYHVFSHSYPGKEWKMIQVEPLQIHGWTELAPGDYRVRVYLKNAISGERFEASQELSSTAGTAGGSSPR